jgi:hypothetical protein
MISYHKYKYFINFIDDYTSYAWVVLLHEKLAAITALKQFMALVKTQYGADIKEWMSDAGGTPLNRMVMQSTLCTLS